MAVLRVFVGIVVVGVVVVGVAFLGVVVVGGYLWVLCLSAGILFYVHELVNVSNQALPIYF